MDLSSFDFLFSPLFLLAIPLAFFPFVIFFDYHKKENVHQSIIYIVVFYSCLHFFIPIFLGFAAKWFYLFLLIPIFIFGIALRKPKNADTKI